MRRSAQVVAPLLAALAASLTVGCHRSDPQRCVDESGVVVDPKFCANLPAGSQQTLTGNPTNGGGHYSGPIFIPHVYRYYYGGGGGAMGSIVSGGSYVPQAGHSYSVSAGRGGVSASGTSRAGFGGSFGHGGGGGE